MNPSTRAEVRRHLAATPERVFAAFASAELVGQWLTPAPEVRLSVLELDFRVGGRYRFAYDTPDGERMLVGGIYHQIEAPTRLVFSWLIEPPDVHAGIESRVTVSIAASASGSELIVLHERFERADANARHAAGWAGALEQLQQLLSSRRQSA
ncbi:MAG TPA: SRPBCC domain-containing protein [Polyangiaceae bacterium]|nr:SRPBCC domain-containing protein [Polyangiaceae bacterium]